MIISKTPYRISFFGGGSDYPSWYLKNGGLVISATINKYIYISCRSLPPYFRHKHRISYSKIEQVKEIKDIKHSVVKSLLENYKTKIKNEGLEIHYDGDFPSRSGVGSSSAFVVGLINVLRKYYKSKISKKILADQSLYLEQKVLKETVGSQDQVAAAFGGFNEIKFYKSGKYQVKNLISDKKQLSELEKRLVLVFVGVRGKNKKANDIAKSYVNKLNNKKKKNINEIIKHARKAKKYLLNRDYDSFGRLLHETWLMKRNLSKSMTSSKIDKLYNLGMKNGALGGKLLGAGSAGYLLFYVKKGERDRFLKQFKNNITINIKFENKGSEIIFNDKRY